MRGKEQRHPKQLQSLAGLGDQDLGVSKDWGGREKCNMVYSVTATGPGCPLAVRKVQREISPLSSSTLLCPPPACAVQASVGEEEAAEGLEGSGSLVLN